VAWIKKQNSAADDITSAQTKKKKLKLKTHPPEKPLSKNKETHARARKVQIS